MPFATAQSYLGMAKESTRGTAVAPNIWVPAYNLAPWDDITMLEDKGLRGAMVPVYNLVQGVERHEYAFAGDVFPDTIGNIFMGLLGNSAVTTGSAGFTDGNITNSSAVLTSNQAVFVQADVGKSITVTGAGPAAGNLTTTIASVQSSVSATLTATASTTVVAAAFTITRTGGTAGNNTHTLGLLNNATSTANQPPSYTVVDTNGFTAAARQITAFQWSECQMKFDAQQLFQYTAKGMGNPSTTIAIPSQSFSTVNPMAAWEGNTVIGFAAGTAQGSINAKMITGQLNFKRTVTPQWTLQASQSPYRLFASEFVVDGKFTFIYEDETDLVRYLNNTQPTLQVRFTQPATIPGSSVTTQSAVAFQMTQCAFKIAKVVRSKQWAEVECDIYPIPNTTDATAGLYSPVKVSIINSQTTQY